MKIIAFSGKPAEVEKCEVVVHSGILGVRKGWPLNLSHEYICIPECLSLPDFVGYLYEDGQMRTHPRVYKRNGGSYVHHIYPTDVISGKAEILTPTHVLFKKG